MLSFTSSGTCNAGKNFSYTEGQAAPNVAVAYLIAGLYQFFGVLLFLRPLRPVWAWLLPRIGVPPGKIVKKYGSWDARVVAESEPASSGNTVTVTAILKVNQVITLFCMFKFQLRCVLHVWIKRLCSS